MKLPLTLIIAACLAISGCSQVIKATKDEPISEDLTQRTTGSLIDDELIEIKALVNLSKASPALESSHIGVTSYNGIVLLTGQVPNAAAKKEAERVVQELRNVRTIHNELEISGPTSHLVRTSDTWLTAKIKTAMLADRAVNSLQIKVVTENGTVYLMGLVTPDQATRAVDLARQAQGVQKVVKIFEYVR